MYPAFVTADFTIQISLDGCLDFAIRQEHFQTGRLCPGICRAAHPPADQHLTISDRREHILVVILPMFVIMINPMCRMPFMMGLLASFLVYNFPILNPENLVKGGHTKMSRYLYMVLCNHCDFGAHSNSQLVLNDLHDLS
jgi:hypothetical protein